jgi:hypothetical protein
VHKPHFDDFWSLVLLRILGEFIESELHEFSRINPDCFTCLFALRIQFLIGGVRVDLLTEPGELLRSHIEDHGLIDDGLAIY